MHDLQSLVESPGAHRRHEGQSGRPRGEGAAALHALDPRAGGQTPAGRGREKRRRGTRPGSLGRRPHPADRSRPEHVGEGAGRAGTGAQDLRPREEPLRPGGSPRTEVGRGVGQLQGDGSHGAGRQGAVRPGVGRSPQGGQGGRCGACPPGRGSRERGRILHRRRDGLCTRDGRGFDHHRRAGRTGGQRLSRRGHPRPDRPVGDLQHQGDPAPGNRRRHPHERLCPGAGLRRRVRGDLHLRTGRLRDMGGDAYAGRV